MVTLSLILLVIAFVCFVVAALLTQVPKVNLVAVGLALWELAQLIVSYGK
ncbi:hypothetical protein QF001_003779 [Paraburkholderia youngii]